MIKNHGGKTFIPAMPQCYLELWHRIVWPMALKKYGGDTNKGSILDKKVSTTNDKLKRIKQFGPTWSWMSLSREAQNQEWAIDANG
jgi:hypothetical protein